MMAKRTNKKTSQSHKGLRPTIFSLLDTPAFGGAEQYMAQALNFLHQEGFPVVLATNNQVVAREIEKRISNFDPQTFRIVQAPYLLDAIGNWKGLVKYFIAAPFAVGWLLGTLRSLQEEARSRKSGVVCLWPGWSDRVTFTPFAKLLKAPVVWIEIGPLGPVFKRTWGFPKLLYSLTKHLPDWFITTSRYTLESMVRDASIDAKKITLVYPGIVLRSPIEIRALQKAGASERKKRRLESCTLITYLGRLASENQIELAIEAFAKTLKAYSSPQKLKLLIIGDGPERTLYERLAKNYEVEKNVHFTGFVDEKTKFSLLAVSDLFLFCRAWEWDGFGMTTIEAMSLGVPVITPRFGPQKEIIEDGKSGLHFEPNNSDSMSQQIVKLLRAPQKRKQIGKAGQKRVQKFTQEKMFHNLLTVVNLFAK